MLVFWWRTHLERAWGSQILGDLSPTTCYKRAGRQRRINCLLGTENLGADAPIFLVKKGFLVRVGSERRKRMAAWMH